MRPRLGRRWGATSRRQPRVARSQKQIIIFPFAFFFIDSRARTGPSLCCSLCIAFGNLVRCPSPGNTRDTFTVQRRRRGWCMRCPHVGARCSLPWAAASHRQLWIARSVKPRLGCKGPVSVGPLANFFVASSRSVLVLGLFFLRIPGHFQPTRCRQPERSWTPGPPTWRR